MGEAFRKRQLDRKVRRLNDEIYDLTAWSLPMAFGITSLTVEGPSKIASDAVDGPHVGRDRDRAARAKVGYLVHADDEAALVALADLLRQGYRAHVFDQPTALAGRSSPRGPSCCGPMKMPTHCTRPSGGSRSTTACRCSPPTPGWSTRGRAWAVFT